MNRITAKKYTQRGRQSGEAEVYTNRARQHEGGVYISLGAGDVHVEIPLDDWLKLIRPTVSAREMWPPQ